MRTHRLLALALAAGSSACYGVEGPSTPAGEVRTPRIDIFSANADGIEPGTTVDLTYSVADAETAEIGTDANVQILPPTTQLAGVAFTRPITADTTFVLTARNKDKVATRTLVVHVRQAEAPKHAAVLSFDGPTSVTAGQMATLVWRTSNADTGVIKAGDQVALTIASADLAAGQFMVGPGSETVYTLAVKGTDGQEVTQTRLVTVTSMGGTGITARELFDRNVLPIIQAKCAACHQGAATDVNGPNWLGATATANYASVTTDPTFGSMFITRAPENSLFLLKGEHAGPAFCNPTNANTQGLNRNCMPTTEEQSVTAWLLKESLERFGATTPPPATTPPMDYTPRTASEALTRFGACMTRTDWDATYGQSNDTQAARQNSTQGPCYSCHSTGTGGAFLSLNSGDTFDYNRLRPSILKLVQPSAVNPDGTFNPALVPAYRWRDKAAGDGTHPNYVMSEQRNQALNEFINRTLARYNDFTRNCN